MTTATDTTEVHLATSRKSVLIAQELAEAGLFDPLQAAVPGLTKAEAKSLIFHARQMRAARLSGYSPLILGYARETWGATPPRAILSGTLKVRVAGLSVMCPGLSLADVRAVVSQRMAEELDELTDAENSGFCFWRFPLDGPNYGDCRAANKMLRARQAAQLAALVDYFNAPLREAHEAALQVLEASGLPFELLASWFQSGRAEVPAATS